VGPKPRAGCPWETITGNQKAQRGLLDAAKGTKSAPKIVRETQEKNPGWVPNKRAKRGQPQNVNRTPKSKEKGVQKGLGTPPKISRK